MFEPHNQNYFLDALSFGVSMVPVGILALVMLGSRLEARPARRFSRRSFVE